jgi:TRAP-type transport system small permease protein
MKQISSYIVKVETAVASVCLASSTLLIFLAAVARSVSRPINWSLDISLFLFAWATFLAADVAFRADKLVNVDVIVHRLPARVGRIIRVATYLLILAFLGLLVVYGFILAYKSRQRPFQGIPGISYSWVTLSLPFGGILLGQTTISKLLGLLRTDADASGTAAQTESEL